MAEKLFVAITRSSNLLSGSLRIVEETTTLHTPIEWLAERIQKDWPDRWVFIIRGSVIDVKSPLNQE